MQAANPPTSPRERLTTQPPLMWFSLVFLAGIVLGSLVSRSLWTWLAFAGLAILLLILARIFAARLQPSTFNLQPLSFLLHPSAFILHPFTFILLFALFLGAARYQ